jgi:hypothetical protein
MIVALPGSTARLKWTFIGDPSQVFYSKWYFTRRGGSNIEVIADKFSGGTPTIANSSLPGVDIEDAATVVLKKVDKRYNGKYRFTMLSFNATRDSAVVDFFIAGKFNIHIIIILLKSRDEVTFVIQSWKLNVVAICE